MTLPIDYPSLLLAVQEEIEDSSNDFVSYIPTAVRLAEKRINRDVDGLYTKAVTTVAASAASRYANKPDGFKFAYSVHYFTNNVHVPLIKKSEDYLLDYWPENNLTGTPKYYADFSKTQIMIAPTPTGNTSLVYSYAKDVPSLSETNTTNTIITYYGDLLFKATLVEQAKFARMPEATKQYEEDYQSRLAGITEENRRERQDNTSPRFRTEIDENRKQGTE